MSFKDYLKESLDTTKDQQMRIAVLKQFGDDPLYKAVLTAKSKEEQAKAVDILKSIRGSQAMENIRNFIKKFMENDGEK